MASWRSSSSGRSSSPSSPLTPIAPHNLPQWLRTTRKPSAVVPPGRYKVLLAALTCILLGWFVTSNLAPQVQKLPTNFDSHSNGLQAEVEDYDYDHTTEQDVTEQHKPIASKQGYKPDSSQAPSIKGALGDLHKAVSDKFRWKDTDTKSTSIKTANITLVSKPVTASNVSETIHELSDAERLGARTRIGKCTILFNGNTYWERAIRTHEAHDRLHNYRLHVLRQHLLDDVWSKPAYILSLLLKELAKPEGERLEWLFWVDADTIILNPYVPIETFLPPADFDDIYLLYSEDWNGLNNGVFPIRVNKWAVELLSAIVTYRYYRPEAELPFRDQSAMNALMKEPKFAKNVLKLPQRWFNAYQGEQNETLAPYQIRRGDFLVHFAGVIDREPRMSFWLDRADQHLDDWEVPLKSTSYPQEVKDFWSDMRVARQNHKNGLSEARLTSSELLNKVEELMNDFGERLSPEQADKIKAAQNALKLFLSDEVASEDVDTMAVRTKELTETAQPLLHAKADNHKILLASAHDAIFAAEKDLLDAGFYRGITSPDLNELDDLVKKLKEMVLASEDTWNRATLTAAVEAVTATRSRVQEMAATVAAAAASASASSAKVAQVAQAGDLAKKLADQKLRAMQAAQAAQARTSGEQWGDDPN